LVVLPLLLITDPAQCVEWRRRASSICLVAIGERFPMLGPAVAALV
jgi:hypothetical protein